MSVCVTEEMLEHQTSSNVCVCASVSVCLLSIQSRCLQSCIAGTSVLKQGENGNKDTEGVGEVWHLAGLAQVAVKIGGPDTQVVEEGQGFVNLVVATRRATRCIGSIALELALAILAQLLKQPRQVDVKRRGHVLFGLCLVRVSLVVLISRCPTRRPSDMLSAYPLPANAIRSHVELRSQKFLRTAEHTVTSRCCTTDAAA